MNSLNNLSFVYQFVQLLFQSPAPLFSPALSAGEASLVTLADTGFLRHSYTVYIHTQRQLRPFHF